MGLFAYVLEPRRARPTTAAMSAHVRYLRALGDVLVCGGPFRDGTGAVVCVICGGEGEADAIARADPLVAFGFMLYDLHELDRVEASQLPAIAS